ncbi:cyclophane-forming radical SAM/SPASM peptide maturase YhhB [Paenibacillus campi]|uniref:cyclophane-forming radical SAM/SPASM peptide maturase YhhB n=1 Tax=Paenibacillus campi TaxID=3106031 RepID=UPI002AFDFDEC|nr:cyclophane-forming radical SAM/SPASM peptide maturase YhhB [Paenibacillus sp. SGZ-1014]
MSSLSIEFKKNNEHYQANFSAALLKITSRCNLNCDYCYVYNHVDQSWKNQPKYMNNEVLNQFAVRLKQYLDLNNQKEFDVIFHGGEPLLYGSNLLIRAVNIIHEHLNPHKYKINFSLQTNGTLLTKEIIDELFAANISISMSLDGPKLSNDLHRVDHKKLSSFERAYQGLKALIDTQSTMFQGVIAVIDPNNSPKALFEFFHPMNLPRLDFLLPDATHTRPPQGRLHSPALYHDWLIEAFELWYTQYSDIPVRWFDSLLASRIGVPSQTDVMGFGSVCLLVIETDGHYSDHDVFKITRHDGALLQQNVFTSSINDISNHYMIREHGYRLSIEGVAQECKQCPALEACGGGSIPHRYHEKRGLDTPTVYCKEIYSVLSKATSLLRNSLTNDAIYPSCFLNIFHEIESKCTHWRNDTDLRAIEYINDPYFELGSISAAALLLHSKWYDKLSIDLFGSTEIRPHWLQTITIQSSQKWLTAPFEDTIEVLPFDSFETQAAIKLLNQVQTNLELYNPSITESMRVLLTDIIFVKSKVGDENGIFSFSDDSAPNVIYIAPAAGGNMLTADDLGDSILHEFLHQILYHFDRDQPLLFDYRFPRFPAPWRSGLRDSSGFLHGTFVFTNLSLYWAALSNSEKIDQTKAYENSIKFKEQAKYGIASLLQFALLTPPGVAFVESLAQALNLELTDIQLSAPGVLI